MRRISFGAIVATCLGPALRRGDDGGWCGRGARPRQHSSSPGTGEVGAATRDSARPTRAGSGGKAARRQCAGDKTRAPDWTTLIAPHAAFSKSPPALQTARPARAQAATAARRPCAGAKKAPQSWTALIAPQARPNQRRHHAAPGPRCNAKKTPFDSGAAVDRVETCVYSFPHSHGRR